MAKVQLCVWENLKKLSWPPFLPDHYLWIWLLGAVFPREELWRFLAPNLREKLQFACTFWPKLRKPADSVLSSMPNMPWIPNMPEGLASISMIFCYLSRITVSKLYL